MERVPISAWEQQIERSGGETPLLGGCLSGDLYTATRLVYAANGRTVTYAMKERWY